jgi:hypothetical protein
MLGRAIADGAGSPNKELKIRSIQFTIFARSRGMFAPCKDKMRLIDKP